MTLADFLEKHLELFCALLTFAVGGGTFLFHWVKGQTVREELEDIKSHLKFQDQHLLALRESTPTPFDLPPEQRSYHGQAPTGKRVR